MRISHLIELQNEITVQVLEDTDVFNKLLHDFECSLGLHDGWLTQTSLHVVYDLLVCLIGIFLRLRNTRLQVARVFHSLKLYKYGLIIIKMLRKISNDESINLDLTGNEVAIDRRESLNLQNIPLEYSQDEMTQNEILVDMKEDSMANSRQSSQSQTAEERKRELRAVFEKYKQQ